MWIEGSGQRQMLVYAGRRRYGEGGVWKGQKAVVGRCKRSGQEQFVNFLIELN